MVHPVVEVDSCGVAASHDVDDTEMVTLFDFDVDGVFILWKDKPCLSFGQKAYLVDIITFKIHVLLVLEERWLEQRTDPGDEGGRLVLQKLDALVLLFVDVDRQLNLQLVRLFVQEALDLVLVECMVVLEVLLAVDVHVQWDAVLLVNLVEDVDLLL